MLAKTQPSDIPRDFVGSPVPTPGLGDQEERAPPSSPQQVLRALARQPELNFFPLHLQKLGRSSENVSPKERGRAGGTSVFILA